MAPSQSCKSWEKESHSWGIGAISELMQIVSILSKSSFYPVK
jgi:hypothetical protein